MPDEPLTWEAMCELEPRLVHLEHSIAEGKPLMVMGSNGSPVPARSLLEALRNLSGPYAAHPELRHWKAYNAVWGHLVQCKPWRTCRAATVAAEVAQGRHVP